MPIRRRLGRLGCLQTRRGRGESGRRRRLRGEEALGEGGAILLHGTLLLLEPLTHLAHGLFLAHPHLEGAEALADEPTVLGAWHERGRGLLRPLRAPPRAARGGLVLCAQLLELQLVLRAHLLERPIARRLHLKRHRLSPLREDLLELTHARHERLGAQAALLELVAARAQLRFEQLHLPPLFSHVLRQLVALGGEARRDHLERGTHPPLEEPLEAGALVAIPEHDHDCAACLAHPLLARVKRLLRLLLLLAQPMDELLHVCDRTRAPVGRATGRRGPLLVAHALYGTAHLLLCELHLERRVLHLRLDGLQARSPRR